jgi:hypothetical protein
VAEGEVQGVEATKTTTAHGNPVYLALPLNIGNQLIGQKFIVLYIVLYTLSRGKVFPVPRFGVKGIYTINLKFAGFDKTPDGFYQSLVFGFVVPVEGTWEKQDRVPPVAKHQHFNVTGKAM